jgi:hypothetical protein
LKEVFELGSKIKKSYDGLTEVLIKINQFPTKVQGFFSVKLKKIKQI